MFGILFFNTLDLSVILQQKKNAKHKDLYMPELALNPKFFHNQTFAETSDGQWQFW